MQYLGHLPVNDRLYGYLKYNIFPQLNCDCTAGIRVFGTNGSNAVYIYEDRATCNKVVGKFFYSQRQMDWDLAYRRLDREHRNTVELRRYLDGVHYAAKVLGRNDDLNRLSAKTPPNCFMTNCVLWHILWLRCTTVPQGGKNGCVFTPCATISI